MALKKKIASNTEVEKAPEVEREEVVETKSEPVVAQPATEGRAVVEREEVVETKSEPVTVHPTTEKTYIATTQPQTPAVNTGNSAVGTFVQQAAEQGFEDVELEGYGAFPIIVLGTDGKFECDGEDWGEDGFVGQLQKTKAVYLCKQKDIQDSPVAYTYDKVNLNSPVEDATTVEELRQLWAEEGETLEIKKYLEVLIEIVGDHEYEGQFFIVKLPPSSSNAFNGQLFIANRKFGIPLNQVKIHFGVGAKRTNGKNKYYPWKFRLVTD